MLSKPRTVQSPKSKVDAAAVIISFVAELETHKRHVVASMPHNDQSLAHVLYVWHAATQVVCYIRLLRVSYAVSSSVGLSNATFAPQAAYDYNSIIHMFHGVKNTSKNRLRSFAIFVGMP